MLCKYPIFHFFLTLFVSFYASYLYIFLSPSFVRYTSPSVYFCIICISIPLFIPISPYLLVSASQSLPLSFYISLSRYTSSTCLSFVLHSPPLTRSVSKIFFDTIPVDIIFQLPSWLPAFCFPDQLITLNQIWSMKHVDVVVVLTSIIIIGASFGNALPWENWSVYSVSTKTREGLLVVKNMGI